MGLDLSSFGRAISSARKTLGLSQKELAAKIKKDDGEAITPQYLNDIEHDRRSPQSDHLVREFARVLKIEREPRSAIVCNPKGCWCRQGSYIGGTPKDPSDGRILQCSAGGPCRLRRRRFSRGP